MSDLINRIAEAIEAEIHEAWTESDADFNRGMEYAVSIVKAVDIRTDGNTISRADAMGAVQDHFNADGFKGYDDGQKMMDRIKALPSAEQVTGKLKNPDDSLLTADSEACKEQKSKLDLIRRQDAIERVDEYINEYKYNQIKCSAMKEARAVLEQLPSAPDSRQRGEWEPLTDYIGNEYFECSKCHDAFYVEFGTPEDNNYNFCPNCGARMLGEDGEA